MPGSTSPRRGHRGSSIARARDLSSKPQVATPGGSRMGAGPGRSFQFVPQTLTSESIQVSEPELIILLQPYSSTCHISLTHSLPPSHSLTPNWFGGFTELCR